MEWVQGGAGVLAGVVGARAIPQIIMAGSNTGAMGYAMNIIATLGLGWIAHMIFPRNRTITASVIAGGAAATLARAITDQTQYGKYLSLTGMGDWGMGLYLRSNFPYPPRLTDQSQAMFTWGDGSQGAPAMVAAAAGADGYQNC
jgi:hypothetical protein